MHDVSVSLIIHIAAGVIALVVAPAAMVARKGALWHRRWGRVYLAAMAMMSVSAIAVSMARGNYIFIVLTTTSWYWAYSGARARKADSPSSNDRAMAIGVALVNVVVTVCGVVEMAGSADAGNLVLGPVGIVYCAIDWMRWRRGAISARTRLGTHIARMILSYASTVTAFIATNTHLPPMITVFGPLAIGISAILLWRRRYVRPLPAV